MKRLLGSQQTAISKMSKLKVGALFMEAGTGKTRAAKQLVESLTGDTDIFWFTPFQTKKNLKAELDKWGSLNCQIIGTESISQSDRLYMQLSEQISASAKPILVVDESLKIKNFSAIRTRRLIELSTMAEYKLILNGTPLSRNLLDLWSQLEFLSPKILNMGETEFKNTFCEYVEITYNSKGLGRSFTKEFIKKYHNLDYLYSLIEPYIFESTLSLRVGQQYIDLSYSISEEEQNEHDRLKGKYLDDKMLLARNNNIFLELTQKMQHNYSASEEKFTIVEKLLEKHDPSKVLIYAKYIDTQQLLKDTFPYVRIMSLGKHAYGLNLQQYNVVIFFDKTWDYAQREQVEHRVYRGLQHFDCIYYDLTANVGLDQLINASILKKERLLTAFKSKTINELRVIL